MSDLKRHLAVVRMVTLAIDESMRTGNVDPQAIAAEALPVDLTSPIIVIAKNYRHDPHVYRLVPSLDGQSWDKFKWRRDEWIFSDNLGRESVERMIAESQEVYQQVVTENLEKPLGI